MRSRSSATSRTQPKRLKVFVGLSGGVDSAVSAALLQKAGHDVTGVFIKVWQPDWIECNWKEERLEAMRAAAHLGIPFATLDLVQEYKRGVIDYMIAEYAAGRTPNPDVMCNREVKFGGFWDWAKAQGAEAIATGHYTRVVEHLDPEGGPLRYSLLKGIDPNKDQSYFLWTLKQSDLEHVLFPVGGLTKPEVRELAARFKLPNADKKDSQGLCFIGKVDIKEFLAHYIKAAPGRVLDQAGQTIGTHPGALFFTLGERHGFTIQGASKTSADLPYFVTAKDMDANTITVSTRSHLVASSATHLSQVNWIGQVPEAGSPIEARSRYRAPLQQIHLTEWRDTSSQAGVSFEQPQEALTPGQSLVMYDGDECLGGGIIG